MIDKSILIKPHHFFDIIKLYGSGINIFIPDSNYNHDFYRIGNLILNNEDLNLTLTLRGDDICNPCKYNSSGCCTDIVSISLYTSKEEYNRIIDKRILNCLKLIPGNTVDVSELCNLIKSKIKTLEEIWIEESEEKRSQREKNLFLGIKKYLARTY